MKSRKEKRYCIYLITNLINGKIYVGKTSDIEERWKSHKRAVYYDRDGKGFMAVHAAIRKYGIDKFIIEVLEEFNSETETYKYETWWIDYLGSFISNGYGYNMNYGGVGGINPSPETRAKISKGNKGRKKSDIERQKISKANTGKKRSDEYKLERSVANTGIGNPFYGKLHSIETKEKISRARIGKNAGENHHFFGKTLSEETKQKMAISRVGLFVGEKNSASKVTEQIVLEIRDKFNTGNYNQKELADEYQVSTSIVSRIILRKTWRHI
jgi:group I intron endonuclease